MRLLLLALGLILGFHLLHVLHYSLLTDDAFISFRYLQNWIEGNGLVFNPGERVEGYTNFLWIVLLAPFAIVHLAPEQVAPILSTGFSLILLVLVCFFPRLARREKDPQPGWLLAPLFLALHRSYAVWATSGLEPRLFTLLVFLGALFAWRASQNLDRRDPLWAGIFFALAELCRPEGSLFFAVGCSLVFALRWLQDRKKLTRADFGGVAVFLGVVLAHFVWRRLYYDLWLPNTFYAKASEPWWGMGLRYTGVFILEYSYWLWLPLFCLWQFRSLRGRNWLPGFLLLFPAPYLLYVMYVGGDHFEFRFFDPALPFLGLLFQELLRDLMRALRRPLSRLALISFALGFLFYTTALPWASGLGFPIKHQIAVVPPVDLNQAPWLKWVPGFQALAAAFQEEYAPLVDGLAAIRAEEHRQFGQRQIKFGRLFARFIREGYLSPDDIICTGGVGAIPYYSRLRTVDYYGLTDAVIARRKRTTEWRFIFHEKSPANSYLEERKVDMVILVGPGSFFGYNSLFKGLPTIPAWGLNPRAWPSRLYLLEMDSWLLSFRSPHRPAEVLAKFQKRNVPIYLFLPEGELAKPVPLAEALARFPELHE